MVGGVGGTEQSPRPLALALGQCLLVSHIHTQFKKAADTTVTTSTRTRLGVQKSD